MQTYILGSCVKIVWIQKYKSRERGEKMIVLWTNAQIEATNGESCGQWTVTEWKCKTKYLRNFSSWILEELLSLLTVKFCIRK